MPDIDIDFADPAGALQGLRHVRAALRHNGQRMSHNSGVYFQDIPTDPLDGLAAWDDPAVAAENGFFKIDCLSLALYRGVRDEEHLLRLLHTEPPWDLFLDRDVVSHLSHIQGHYDIVAEIAPRSIYDLAVCIALIRPGKRYLVGRPREKIEREIWLKADRFHFKKPHAVSYAATIVVQLNLLLEELAKDD